MEIINYQVIDSEISNLVKHIRGITGLIVKSQCYKHVNKSNYIAEKITNDR